MGGFLHTRELDFNEISDCGGGVQVILAIGACGRRSTKSQGRSQNNLELKGMPRSAFEPSYLLQSLDLTGGQLVGPKTSFLPLCARFCLKYYYYYYIKIIPVARPTFVSFVPLDERTGSLQPGRLRSSQGGLSAERTLTVTLGSR